MIAIIIGLSLYCLLFLSLLKVLSQRKLINLLLLMTFSLLSKAAYRFSHSTETVLLHLTNQIAVTRSSHLISCMIMLDLSPAFDTVDHA